MEGRCGGSGMFSISHTFREMAKIVDVISFKLPSLFEHISICSLSAMGYMLYKRESGMFSI